MSSEEREAARICHKEDARRSRDYKAAAGGALNKLQHKLATKVAKQKVKLESENELTQDHLTVFEATISEETRHPAAGA